MPQSAILTGHPCGLVATSATMTTAAAHSPRTQTDRLVSSIAFTGARFATGALVNELIDLCALVAERRAQILERWTRRLSVEHADKDLSRAELRDHLPGFLDEVRTALRAEASADLEPQDGAENSASAEHGVQRLRAGFDLAEVVHEYELLTECILDEVEAVGRSISTQAFRRVLRLLDQGRADAVSSYVARRDDELHRAHSQHVAFIAHELRTPMMSALMAVAALRNDARSEDEWALTMLTRNLTTLRELLDQVLIADRLTGSIQLARDSLDLRALLEEVCADVRLFAKRRQVEVMVTATEGLPIQGDRRLLRSALGNLIGNAVKFTHEGNTVEVRAAHREDAIRIEVEDQCGGLPAGDPQELFAPFVQRGMDKTGFGLGLAIVKQAAEAHGGKVSVHNLPGKGCVFSLELPCAN